MIKISGLDKLNRTLKDAQKAMSYLEYELGTVNFNPNDPESIEAAIQNMEAMVDERLGQYSSNDIIGPMAASMKEQYREAIIERAAAARLEYNDEEEEGEGKGTGYI